MNKAITFLVVAILAFTFLCGCSPGINDTPIDTEEVYDVGEPRDIIVNPDRVKI